MQNYLPFCFKFKAFVKLQAFLLSFTEIHGKVMQAYVNQYGITQCNISMYMLCTLHAFFII